jgi:chromosome partitioning protein
LRDHFPELVFDTVIPRSVRVAEAPSFAIPVTQHAPSSRGSLAYEALARELAERERADRVRVERTSEDPVGPVMEVGA